MTSNKIIKLGNTLKLKWNLNGIEKYSRILVLHSHAKKLDYILQQIITSYNISIKVPYYGTRDDPNQNRISGYLNLVDGNGTLTLDVKSI